MAEKIVEIIMKDSTLSVDKNAVTVYKTDTIRWVSKEDDFEVIFVDGSPFEGQASSGSVVIKKGEASRSLTVRNVEPDPNYDRRKESDGKVIFKYSVKCGKTVLDPDIIVDPDGP